VGWGEAKIVVEYCEEKPTEVKELGWRSAKQHKFARRHPELFDDEGLKGFLPTRSFWESRR